MNTAVEQYLIYQQSNGDTGKQWNNWSSVTVDPLQWSRMWDSYGGSIYQG